MESTLIWIRLVALLPESSLPSVKSFQEQIFPDTYSQLMTVFPSLSGLFISSSVETSPFKVSNIFPGFLLMCFEDNRLKSLVLAANQLQWLDLSCYLWPLLSFHAASWTGLIFETASWSGLPFRSAFKLACPARHPFELPHPTTEPL
jgi:hypothetical protein